MPRPSTWPWALFGLAIVALIIGLCVAVGAIPAGAQGGATHPRLVALFSQPNRAAATDSRLLQRLADVYDGAIFWHDAQSWRVEGQTPMRWVKQRNPAFRAWAYAPAGYWWIEDADCAVTPTRCEVRKLLDDNGLWLLDPMGQRVEPWPGQGLVDAPRAAAALDAHWRRWYDPTAGWNGMAWDVTDGNFHYRGGQVDFDRSGQEDAKEHGFQWLDDTWTAGLREMTKGVGGFPLGNGAWMPKGRGELSQLAPPLRGSIVELPSRWRNPQTGRWEPAANSQIVHWHIENLLALKARDPDSLYLILAKEDLFRTAYWQRYLPSPLAQQRLALAVALLTDNALLMRAYGDVPWCDECGAVGGATAWRKGWLGKPLGPAQRSGNIWWREFEAGVVYLNASEESYRMQPAPTGLRRIKGWYDSEHNNGAPWDGSLAPYEAIVLWRQQAATPTPTARLTPTPTVDLRDLLRRVERLERQMDALRKALQEAP